MSEQRPVDCECCSEEYPGRKGEILAYWVDLNGKPYPDGEAEWVCDGCYSAYSAWPGYESAADLALTIADDLG